MHPLEDRLSKIEARLQRLVEGGAARLFPGAGPSHLFAQRLLETLHQGLSRGLSGSLRQAPDGALLAPERLVLQVNPGELELFRSPRRLQELEEALRLAGQEAGVRFSQGHFLQVEPLALLAPGELSLEGHTGKSEPPPISHTTDVVYEPDASPELPPSAFLVVDGVRIFPLDQPVVNIGRRPDNHLVLDDPRVSRTHAQLRLVRGRFVIFDLDSRGGTWVNGRRVHQQALRPGDVIALSGFPLVFGQDTPSLGATQEVRLED
jgi:hypothetical protein